MSSSTTNFFSKENAKNQMFAYSYWCQIPLERKSQFEKNHLNIFQQITHTFRTLKKEPTGDYQPYDAPLSELWKNLYCSAYIDMSQKKRFESHEEVQQFVEKTIKALGVSSSVTYEYIVIDDNWEKIFRNTPNNQLTMCTYQQDNFLIFSYNEERNNLLTLTDTYTKQFFLRCLVSRTLFDTEHYSWSEESLRMCIPAIDDYPALAVKEHVAGIASQLFYTENSIISPFTAKDLQQLEVIGEKGFPAYITGLPAYEKLLDFVVENQIEPDKYTRKEIDTAYQKLTADYLKAMNDKK